MFMEKEKLKKDLWQYAEKALFALYGEKPDARILNRFYNEKKIFEETDAIIVWDITADIRLEAKKLGYLTNLTGTDSSCFVAYLMGASDLNPLALHYHCPQCGNIEFLDMKHALPWDVADKLCQCDHTMRADGFGIPYEMHIGSTKAHLTVAPPVMEIAECIIKERVRGIYSCITRIRRNSSASATYIWGEKTDGNYPGITLVSSSEYDRAQTLTDATGVDFYEILAGISDRYLSDPRIVQEISKGNNEGIGGFDFNSHSRAKQLTQDLAMAAPKNSFDLLQFLGAVHGTRNWLYNANVLVRNGVCKVGDLPSHRDDVFLTLRDEAGVDADFALNVANKMRKGRLDEKLTDEECMLLAQHTLPSWFIPYIEKVHYMSVKATTIGILRIALAFMWYKIHYPANFDKYMRTFVIGRK